MAVDISILRDSIERLNLTYRWVPTKLMIADYMTKDQNMDMLRAVGREGKYQIHPESVILEAQRRERERREERAAANRQKEQEKKSKEKVHGKAAKGETPDDSRQSESQPVHDETEAAEEEMIVGC